MRIVRSLAIATLMGTSALTFAAAPAFAQACTCPSSANPVFEPGAVVSDQQPPPLPDYDQPPPPADNYLWTPGNWSWNGYDYYWVPGVWVAPPQPGLLWTPGYWGYANGAYAFHRGFWGKHVGFYGGVDYGFGYGGAGFEGGYWQGDSYYYNRSVTNVAVAAGVTLALFDKPVPQAHPEFAHVGFNGGPHGVVAKPTAAELAAAKETHLAPTPAQVQQQRVASRTESAFVSTNNGKPPIAATTRPGEFKGAAVVPAKAAGGPLPQPQPQPMMTATPTHPGEKPALKTEEKAPGAPSPSPSASPTGANPKPELKTEPKAPGKPSASPSASPTRANPKPELKTEPKAPGRPSPSPSASPTRANVNPAPKPTPAPEFRPAPNATPKPALNAAPKQTGKPENKACGKPGEPPCP